MAESTISTQRIPGTPNTRFPDILSGTERFGAVWRSLDQGGLARGYTGCARNRSA